MSKLTVVGSINADLIVHAERHPHPGETLLGSGGEILAGGKGANQAVAAAQLGANVAFVGAVGSDPYAEPAMHYMHSSGIDLSAVEQSDTTTGLAVITVSADGENTIVISPARTLLSMPPSSPPANPPSPMQTWSCSRAKSPLPVSKPPSMPLKDAWLSTSPRSLRWTATHSCKPIPSWPTSTRPASSSSN